MDKTTININGNAPMRMRLWVWYMRWRFTWFGVAPSEIDISRAVDRWVFVKDARDDN